MRDVTPSSQAKKSNLDVRRGICVTVGKGFKEVESDEGGDEAKTGNKAEGDGNAIERAIMLYAG